MSENLSSRNVALQLMLKLIEGNLITKELKTGLVIDPEKVRYFFNKLEKVITSSKTE